MTTNDDGASSAKARRKTNRKFVTIPLSTLERPDGFEVVAAGARSVGMRLTTYVRDAVIRRAIDDIGKAKAAQAARIRKAG